MSNFDVDFFKDLLKDERRECLDGPGIDLDLHEDFVKACRKFQDAREAKEAAQTEDEIISKTKKMNKYLDKCVEAAKPILETVDLMQFDLEMSLLRTAILTRGGAKSFAKFANQSDLHGHLIETLLNNKKIMKDMILNGGPTEKKFGNAMKLYTQIMAGVETDRFHKVNKKLAMAAALEFASPKTEFDTSVEIDAQKRFNHYSTAHKKGELDPSFSFFSTWEYRMAINSDAPDEQLQWARDMQMNFAPHIATIYNERWRYSYQVTTDVGYRAPHWTSSPRTYQQLLSGGGYEGPRAWFGRFICRAFGIPVWGFKQETKHNIGVSRWTPKGWEMNFQIPNSDFDSCFWEDRPGKDFIEEVNARAAVSEQEYYEKVILLDCLGDACKEKVKEGEPRYVDPDMVWKSLALIQRKIFATQVGPKSFERTGPSVVFSKIDKYIQNIDDKAPPVEFDMDDRGVVTIPAATFVDSAEEKHVRRHQSFGGGTQLHLVNGEGYATYKIPPTVSFFNDRDYLLTATVSTVHLSQQNLKIKINNGDNGTTVYEVKVPYTQGEWQDTPPVKIYAGGMESFKISRKKASDCFGLAIKCFTLEPIAAPC